MRCEILLRKIGQCITGRFRLLCFRQISGSKLYAFVRHIVFRNSWNRVAFAAEIPRRFPFVFFEQTAYAVFRMALEIHHAK